MTAQHLPYLYEIRFSVEENLLHPHQIQYLQRKQALEDINQGGGWICKHGDDYAGVGFGLFIPEPLIGGLFVKPEYQSKGSAPPCWPGSLTGCLSTALKLST